MGLALIGAEEGEEIEILVGSYIRSALIERVEKAPNRTHRHPSRSLRSTEGYTRETPDPSPIDALTSRRTGTYAFELRGERVEEGSVKAAYISCLRKFAELDLGS